MKNSKTFNRRDFLKLAGASGLALASPLGGFWGRRPARAASGDGYQGPLWIMVHCGGGWDPTSFCDPKGRVDEEQDNPVNNYFIDDIGTAGKLSYAPVPGMADFFDKYSSDLLVINGIDTSTNGHDSGTRFTWSGKLAEGHPSLAALIAGAHDPTAPLAFVTNGGYDASWDIVSPTRVGNTNVLSRLAYPNRISTGDPASVYHGSSANDLLAARRAERLDRQRSEARLPKESQALSALYTARASENQLAQLTLHLPEELDNTNNPLRRQSQLAIASYKAGLTISANLVIGGFDTHGNHDVNQFARMTMLVEGLDFIMEEAARQGVADDVVVVVGSDFGRTPWYNEGNGKDHWSITSMVMMGAGIEGNRVIGATTPGHSPLTVDPDTLELDESGIRITPELIHASLRGLAGVSDSEVTARYPLKGEALPLFT